MPAVVTLAPNPALGLSVRTAGVVPDRKLRCHDVVRHAGRLLRTPGALGTEHIGVAFALDTSGAALAHAVDAGAGLVKPRLGELRTLTGMPLAERGKAIAAAQALCSLGGRARDKQRPSRSQLHRAPPARATVSSRHCPGEPGRRPQTPGAGAGDRLVRDGAVNKLPQPTSHRLRPASARRRPRLPAGE